MMMMSVGFVCAASVWVASVWVACVCAASVWVGSMPTTVLRYNAPLRLQGGSLRIQNSTFVRNRAVRAGAIIMRNSKLDANLTSFSNNGNGTAAPEVTCPNLPLCLTHPWSVADVLIDATCIRRCYILYDTCTHGDHCPSAS